MKLLLALIAVALLLSGGYYWYTHHKTNDSLMNNSEMLAGTGTHEIMSGMVSYAPGVEGFYAEPTDQGEYPGVVMVHEWWGLNDNIKTMAGELAKNGYRVLAVDLFGSVATTQQEAMAQITGFDQVKGTANLKAAAAYLHGKNVPKIASLGWCFGGGQSLQLALSGEKLDATVIYYGQLATSTDTLKAISWPVLGIFGEKDASIPTTTVQEFGNALQSLGIKHSINLYPNVGHAFANPSGANYAAEETTDAWKKTLAFLRENLQ